MTVAETVVKTASETATKPVADAITKAGEAATEGIVQANEAVTKAIQSEGFSAFMDKLSEAATAITGKLVETAPVALDALLGLIRFKGIFEVTMDLVFLAIPIIILFTFGKKVWAWTVKNIDECTECVCTICMLFFGPLLVWAFFSLHNLFNFTNWLSALYPEGILAIKALEAVGIKLL